MKKTSSKQQAIIVFTSVIIVILLIVVSYLPLKRPKNINNITSANSKSAKEVDQKVVDVEKASADLIKAVLSVYYLTNSNSYPVNIDQLLQEIQANTQGNYDNTSYKSVKDSIDNLQDFHYSRRGDGEAYQFTYNSVSGIKMTEKANYQQDYQ